MALSTTRSPAFAVACLLALLTSGAHASVLLAEGDPGYADVDARKPKTDFQYHVDSRPDGVYVQISARQTVGGDSPANPPPPQAAAPVAPASPIGNAPASAPPQPAPAPAGRSWYDPVQGYFNESPDGHLTNLAGMPIGIGAAEPGGWYNTGSQDHPASSPMSLWVDGSFQDVVWIPDVPPNNVHFGPPPNVPPDLRPGGGGGTDPGQVALDVEAHIPLPSITIRENPSLGLVAVSAWYWVDGYDGQAFGQSRTITIPPAAPGLPPTSFTVTVRVWPDHYEWNFGDGASLTTHSLGQRYPAESDVGHVYEYSSLPYPSGFSVQLTVQFAAEFRVNGGGAQALPPIRHTYQANYQVQEVQSILDMPQHP